MLAMNSERPVRVGIMGCSDIARRKFIPALLQSSRASFTALASRSLGCADLQASAALPEAVSYDVLLERPDIDLVYISLPNHLHEEWTIRALELGKHVICEKPLGLSAASVKRMLDAAVRNGRLLYENLMYLHHPQHASIKGLVNSGVLGRVLALHSEFTIPELGEGNFRTVPEMGGGAFHDLNRYPLSAALFFLKGNDYRVLSKHTAIRDGLVTSFKGEAATDLAESFSFQVAFGQQYRSYYVIVAERGSIRLERAYTTPADMRNRVFVKIDGKDASFTAPASDHFLEVIGHVCELLREGAWSREHERIGRVAELAGLFYES